jgi:AAA domain
VSRPELTPEELALAQAEDDRRLLEGVRDGAWLDARHFDPLRWSVPGLIPEGLTLIVGPPKAGKSALILNLLLAVSAGGVALSAIKCGPPRPVLYLALEDGDRRMQDRCRVMLGDGEHIPDAFGYYTKLTEPHRVPATIQAWLRAHPDTAMIVIDTLTQVLAMSRRHADAGENATVREYRNIDYLKRIAAERPGLCMVVLHHARKKTGEEGGDFIERVSGTTGLTAAADTIMVVDRSRGEEAGLIQVTGRDLPEGEYAATFARLRNWRLDGGDLAAAARMATARRMGSALGADMRRLLDVIGAARDGIHTRELAELFPDWGAKVNTYAARLADRGLVIRAGRGLYYPATDNTDNTDNTDSGPNGFISSRVKDSVTNVTNTPHTYNRGGSREEMWPEGTLGDAANPPLPDPPPDDDEPPEDV